MQGLFLSEASSYRLVLLCTPVISESMPVSGLGLRHTSSAVQASETEWFWWIAAELQSQSAAPATQQAQQLLQWSAKTDMGKPNSKHIVPSDHTVTMLGVLS